MYQSFQRRPIAEVLDVKYVLQFLLTVEGAKDWELLDPASKSVLLSMITKSTDADVVVVSL